jgi:hypothetical protein
MLVRDHTFPWAVSDTGAGMDEHTRKRAMGAAGLGRGSGTTFEIYLPRAGDQVDTGEPTAAGTRMRRDGAWQPKS